MARTQFAAVAVSCLALSASAADFHVFCPYDARLCASYDDLDAAVAQGRAAREVFPRLQADLLNVSQAAQRLVVERAESWPLKDDRTSVGGAFEALEGLRAKVDALAGSQGAASPSGAQVLADERNVDRLVASLPKKSDPPAAHEAFGAQIASLQAEVGGLARVDRTAGSPSAARLAALRDALAMLAAVNGPTTATPQLRQPQAESLLQTKQGATGSSPAPAAPHAPAARIEDAPVDPGLAARIQALPYAPRIKGIVRLIAAYADPVDAESTIRTLEKFKPSIEISGFALPSDQLGYYDTEANRIVIKPGWVTAIEDPAKIAEETPFEGRRLGMRTFDYHDHIRYEFRDEELAGHLIHEVQHVRRHGDGGGVNNFSNELDAFDIQERFFWRLLKRAGGSARLSQGATDRLETWRWSPAAFVNTVKEDYLKNHEFQKDEVTIDQQTAAYSSRLRSLEASADVLSNNPKAVQATAELRRQLATLKRDRELNDQAREFNHQWRIRMGIERAPRENK